MIGGETNCGIRVERGGTGTEGQNQVFGNSCTVVSQTDHENSAAMVSQLLFVIAALAALVGGRAIAFHVNAKNISRRAKTIPPEPDQHRQSLLVSRRALRNGRLGVCRRSRRRLKAY